MTLLLPLDRPDARSMQSSYPTVDSSVGTGLVVGIVAPGWRIGTSPSTSTAWWACRPPT